MESVEVMMIIVLVVEYKLIFLKVVYEIGLDLDFDGFFLVIVDGDLDFEFD